MFHMMQTTVFLRQLMDPEIHVTGTSTGTR